MKTKFVIPVVLLGISIVFIIAACQKEMSVGNGPANLLPGLTTAPLTAITNTTATGGGNITSDGGSAITARGVCWSTSVNPVVSGNHTTDGSGTGVFTSALSGLTASTLYYVRAYATNSNGTFYGNQVSFTSSATSGALATLTTTTASAITATTATSGGNVTADGGAAVTARGICWSTSTNPDIAGNHTTDGNGLGVFTSALTSLTASTIYYVRAYATNSNGTAYGNEISFTTTTTAPVLPTVTTTAVSSVTSTTAAGGGNVTADGGAAVTARGVCWSTTPAPVVSGNHTTNGTGTGIFTSAVTGLSPVTTYYIRAYATNSVGTAYGNEISLTTPVPDVYVAGNKIVGGSIPTAMLWKNGVEVPLQLDPTTTQSGATSVYVWGGDVYATGFQYNGTINKPTMWKNGVPTILQPLLANSNPAEAKSVVVSDGDVYVIGNRRPASDILRMWKNGVGADVSGGFGSTGYSLFVSGTDVYISGVRSNFPPANDNAIIWKNGTAEILPSGGAPAHAASVFVSGTDVHAVGSIYVGGPSIYQATYWKNAVATPLTDGTKTATASSVFVSGSDVYVVGYEYNGVRNLAKLWKNGVVSTLPTSTPNTPAFNCRATSVYIIGPDVYIIGTERAGNDKIVLWKNGIQSNITDGSVGSFCQGAFVQ